MAGTSSQLHETQVPPSLVPAAGCFRWVICSLLFFAATLNYVDRQVIALLKPMLQQQLHWSEIDYSNIVLAFQIAYGVGYLAVGRFIDWLGTRKGFSLAVFVWSIAAMAHALARGLLGFSVARFALGLGEAGNFPASIKTVAEWFPKKERALATGIFNSGTNIGAMVAPLVIPWLTLRYGWQVAFVATGALGFIWLVLWLAIYRSPEQHRSVSAAELAYIRSDPVEPVAQFKWRQLLGYRQLWAVAVGKGFTDPIWYLFLFWLPDFLYREHQVKLSGMFWPLFVIYNCATLGSIVGGWISSALIRRGTTVNRGRKSAMLVCGLCVLPIIAASRVTGLWSAVALIGLATAAHQGWSANVYTLASDMFPKRAVGSVVGFAGLAGAITGMMIAKVVGYILQFTGSYVFVFLLAGSAYLLALLIIQLLVPRLEPVQLD